jgi:glycosyl transferase family 25
MFEFVDKVVYINLAHRTDRKEQIEEVLKVIPSEKVLRFDAIKQPHGGVGCTMSHIAVLEMAQREGWKNYLVVEDDAVWNKFEEGYALLETLIKNPYDVIVLGAVFAKYTPGYKLLSCQTTTAYIVNSNYYPVLLQNFKEGLMGFIQTGRYNIFAIDQYWKRIQPRDTWYATVPSLMVQRAGYSDIEKAMIDNSRYFS